METVLPFDKLATKPELTPTEKMLISALSLLSVTAEYRVCTLEQVYARVASGADVRIDNSPAAEQN